MSETIPVRILQETVNDNEVLIQQWRVRDGEIVAAGQILAEVETSKSVIEITSPAAGTVELKVQQGREAAVGEILCLIRTESLGPAIASSVDKLPHHYDCGTTSGIDSAALSGQSTRFSHRALTRLKELGKSPTDFEGRGLIRLRDIESSVHGDNPEQVRSVAADSISVCRNERTHSTSIPDLAAAANWKSVNGVEFDASQLSRSKRLETRLLSWSTHQAIRSSVSVIVPTHGQNILRAVIPDISQIVSAQIISVTARLLREFPAFNACCLNDEVRHYRDIHIGFAVDAGHGLRVTVIRSADKLSLEQIREARDELIAAYLNNRLQPEQTNGATFTISDLSNGGVSTFDPLISEGQSAILGIGSESGETGVRNGYPLILSFDHRLAEGRAAAMFLNRIREQMVSLEREILQQCSSLSARLEPKCSRCGMTSSTAAQRQHFLTETLAADWSKRLVCTICLQGR